MIRVLVADDSATVRELISATLESDPALRIVGHARDGFEAVRRAAELRPDVITMDIHMPGLDGVAATKEIMIETPTPIVIVSSAISDSDIGLSLDATRAGALVALPSIGGGDDSADRRRELVETVKAMAQVKVVRRRPARPPRQRAHAPTHGAEARVLAMAASTGGPAALQRVLGDLPRDFPLPVLIVQHIATDFVHGFCRWLNTACQVRVKVATHGEPLEPRNVYLAPDGQHLTVGPGGTIRLSPAAPVDGFRPSASPLFESVASVYGAGTIAVILTGMGRDGVAGLHAVRAAGGRVIAQDEATSVVFGMPAQATREGVVDFVLPLHEIGARILELANGSCT
ncbi:MAG TPA: chemotaxis-specific protein-glutamate methyltransferase CheB [Longimicrobiales bacterium]